MSAPSQIEISDVPSTERDRLRPILEQSFEGLYRWHAKRTLGSVELVRAARLAGEDAGLAMLKTLTEEAGYVYYIAVSPRFRRRGVGGALLDDALAYFAAGGKKVVYASVEEDNVESKALFGSRGFSEADRGELSKKYGAVRGFTLSREMMLVRGEVLLRKMLVQ